MSTAESSTIFSPPSTSTPTDHTVSTSATTASSTTTNPTSTTPTSSSSKLQPAPAPLVSAWGKTSSTTPPGVVNSTSAATPKAASTGIQKEHWPSAEAALVPSFSKESGKDPKVAIANAPKPKAGGKGKWVPLKAELVFSSPNNNNKKKNNTNNNKKKQTQGGSKQQQNNKGGKDNKNKKSNPTDSNSNSKSHPKSNGSNDKKVDNVTKAVEDLKVDVKSAKKTENAASNQTKESTAPVNGSEEKAASTGPKAEAKPSPTAPTVTFESSLTQDSQAQTSISSSASPVQQAQDLQQQYHPQQQNYYNNKKKIQHRNSEPSNQFLNNSQYQPNNKGARRYNSNKNNFNNFRHSIGGPVNYGNVPFFQLNYPYMPIVAPGFNYGNFMGYPNPGSRSNSTSPANGDFLPMNGVGIPNAAPINPVGGYPYLEDALVLISNQVSYYFAVENLVKDIYLRKQMNSKGFVPLRTLIQFNRLKALTGGDIQLLYSSISHLTELEVVNDKIRARENWSNWVLPIEQRDEAGKEEDTDDAEAEAEHFNQDSS